MLFLVADTETTGLPFHRAARVSQQPRIIEVAGILTDGVDVIDQFEAVCNPGVAIEQIITDITGFTNADLAGKPPFEKAVPAIKAFFQRADAVIFHNASFDRSMFIYDLQRIGKGLEDIAWPELTICTVEETMAKHGRRMKLSELYNMHVGPYVQKHRALDDVLLLHKVAQTLGVYEAYANAKEVSQ